MKSFVFSVLVFLPFLAVSQAFAQEATRSLFEVSPSGEAYLDSLRYRRIDTDVAYFDPTAPPPELKTTEEPPKERDRSGTFRTMSWEGRFSYALFSALVIAGIAYLFYRFGGRFSVSLRPQLSNPSVKKRTGEALVEGGLRLPDNLRQILNMPDRNAALVLLAQTALEKSAAFHGLLVQQSWTWRDALRRLPRDQKEMPALRELVLASERVQFGGRNVSEDEFGRHVEQIKPLLSKVWA